MQIYSQTTIKKKERKKEQLVTPTPLPLETLEGQVGSSVYLRTASGDTKNAKKQ